MMKKYDKNYMKDENGAIIIEGVFGVLVSVITMSLLLSFGFYLYQRTVFQIVANEIAEEIVMTYKFLDVDDCRNITLSDIQNIGHYRYLLFSGKYDSKNEAKGNNLANERLSKTSLALSNEPKIQIEKVNDDIGRMHYEITLTQDYEFMMGDLLSMIGMSDFTTLSTTVYVESVDVSNYINSVKMVKYMLDKLAKDVPLAKLGDAAIKLVNAAMKLGKAVYDLF